MKTKLMRNGLMATTTLCGLLTGVFTAAVVTSVALLPTTALAQDLTSGTLSGTVKTPSGTPAAGATVTVTGKTTGYSKTVTTKTDGTFSITSMPTGTYLVEIKTADGANATETVLVSLGSISNYDFTTSSASEVVVKGKAKRNIDFNRTTIGTTINVQAFSETVPVGRTLESLANTVPGISINGSFSNDFSGGTASISGASPAENIYYIDGMNVTDFRTFLGGSTVPFDFYDQIEVKTAGYSAEFGRSTGGAFVATARTGSNTFHGGFTHTYAPNSMMAHSPVGVLELNGSTPKNIQHDTGGDQIESNFWLSGPVLKDHIYFFTFYNPRDISDSYKEIATNGIVTKTATRVRKDPFWGGKMTFQLNPDQRIDWTYFKDDQTEFKHYVDDKGNDSPVLKQNGGLNRIVKYTGKFTDWFTLSMLYGNSAYNQTSSSLEDSVPGVFEDGSVVRGNQDLLVEVGKDQRKNYRIDADFYYNFFGKHHTRVGGDLEKLSASAVQKYSGNIYYRYYGPGTDCGSTGTITNSCVRVRELFNGGSFNVENQATYIQDDWAVTDRLNLNIGLRLDTFDNRNAANVSFIKNENLFSPRLGFSYDLYGDKTTKLTGFVGRYYLPIAANTNLRMAGGEFFTQKFYTYTSRDPNTLVPVLGTWLNPDPNDYVLGDGSVPNAETLVSHNIEPQYEDEISGGYERRLSNGIKIGVSGIYRKLSSVLEDSSLKYTNQSVCAYLNLTACDGGDFGSTGYILINPGKDAIITLGDAFGANAGKVVTIPASVIGLPQAERTYKALQFTVERPDDGKWFLNASLTLSESKGNIEGGVKSDNGQTDTGLTQDFDSAGWTDGSNGLLPNHHGYSLKGYGAYHFTEKLSLGVNASLLSPRKFGCYGYYPKTDGRADVGTSSAWYCQGKLTPRGSMLESDWIHNVDLSLTYKQNLPIGTVRYSADVFNVFNAQGVTTLAEQGDFGGATTPNKNYGKPSNYQTPRTVRFTIKYAF